MTAWVALFKKELRLGSSGFLAIPAGELLVMLLGVLAVLRWHNGNIPVVIGAVLLGCHMFYLVAFLFASAVAERKTIHLWLGNPLAGWKMLGAKLSAGLVSMFFSFALAGLYTWAGMLFAGTFRIISPHFHVYRLALAITLFIFWVALEAGVSFLILWMIFTYLYSRIGKWAWLVAGALIVAVPYFYTLMANYGILKAITTWGALPTSFNRYWAGSYFTGTTIYTGDIVFDAVTMLIFFALSSWLLDHCIEVPSSS